MADEKRRRQVLPYSYYLDESDPDVPILRRQDGAFVTAFSAQGATREDYKSLLERMPEGDDEGQDPSDA